MNYELSTLAANWIEQHKNEIEEHREDYSWIPRECAAYNTLQDVVVAFGQAGIKPFDQYQNDPKNLFNLIWHCSRGTQYVIFLPNPVHASKFNFQVVCKVNAQIAKVLGLDVYKYTGKIDPIKQVCPYIITNKNQDLVEDILISWKLQLYSTDVSKYKLVRGDI